MSAHLPAPEQEEDRLPARPIILSGLASLVIAIGASIFAAWLAHAFSRPHAAAAAPPPSSTIDRDPITTMRGLEMRAEQREELERWSWVDAGTARIPIERAMQITLEKER